MGVTIYIYVNILEYESSGGVNVDSFSYLTSHTNYLFDVSIKVTLHCKNGLEKC